jgi:formate--tetrahydrofolate ligase
MWRQVRMSPIPSDIEIAQAAKMKPIIDVAHKLGIKDDEIELFGNYKAKISFGVQHRLKDKPDGKLVLVTAITPTPMGEGKTTIAIGLGEAMYEMGYKVINTLREPSLGPVFGIKGGAAGGGYAQVVPMEDINLHFTGDIHAMTTANNLLSAMIDNHLHFGNELGIDPKSITWRRALDMNDRALRNVIVGLGRPADGVVRQDQFLITVASEIMAIMCLATDVKDLKKRLGDIVIGYNRDKKPVRARDLKADGAMTVLLKEALKPNLCQTLNNSPAFVHGGPFANIAHGTNTVVATRMALKLADYVLIEAGFGADLGAEKFMNIVSRLANYKPAAVVLVATMRALKYHGGVNKKEVLKPNPEAVRVGLPNMFAHIENMQKFGVPVVVAINEFVGADTEEEIKIVADALAAKGVHFARSQVVAKGAEGGKELAKALVSCLETKKSNYAPIYKLDIPLKEKIETVAREIYRADGVVYTNEGASDLKKLEKLGFGGLPICMAKTQASITDNPGLVGVPTGWKLTVREAYVSAGAGFVVVICGDMMLMPGLPREPAAEKIDIDENGQTFGLF